MQLHPIRATIAILMSLATIAFLFLGIEIPDAWWGAYGVIITFYFMSS